MGNTWYKSVWNKLLWKISQDTGQVARDHILENAFVKIFHNSLVPKVKRGEKILNTKFDPIWLSTIETPIKKG